MWLERTVEEGAQEGALGGAAGREQWCQCPVLQMNGAVLDVPQILQTVVLHHAGGQKELFPVPRDVSGSQNAEEKS